MFLICRNIDLHIIPGLIAKGGDQLCSNTSSLMNVVARVTRETR
jgi:hypothetical protein